MITTGSFRPSSHGFHFPNYWPPGTPALTVRTPLGAIPVGSAANGLCGGMCFAARDLWTAGRQPPADRQGPPGGSAGLDYLTRRLLASWNLPKGVLTFYTWAYTTDQDTAFGVRPGVSRLTIEKLPEITAAIDAGDPVPLGLVTVRSPDPRQLSSCHYVLAYGYQRDRTRLTLRVYDPNSPDRDDVFISSIRNHPPTPAARTRSSTRSASRARSAASSRSTTARPTRPSSPGRPG